MGNAAGSMVMTNTFLTTGRQFLRALMMPTLAVAVLLPGMVSITIVGGSASATELAEEAEAFILDMSKTAIIRLTDPDISSDERKVRMRDMMAEYFHVPGIAQWVLGRFWRQASSEERNEYLALFEDLMVESYVDRFDTYSGETLVIVKTDVRDGKDVIVSSTMTHPETNKPVQVDWRVRVRGGEYKVVDIMVEGVSMGQTQRSEFASAIKNNGGDIKKFLTELRERIVISGAGA
jgi:phospholipid transport system substrate-binding protein